MSNYLWIIGIFVSTISLIGFSLLYNYMCHQCTQYRYSSIVLFLVFASLVMLIISGFGVNGDVSFGCSSIDLFKQKINSIIENSQNRCIDYITTFENNSKEAKKLEVNLEEYLKELFKRKNPGQKCPINLDLTSFEKVLDVVKLRTAFNTLLENNDYNNFAKNKSILEIFVNSAYSSINPDILKNEFATKHVMDSINDILSQILRPESMVIASKIILEKK